MSGKKIKKINKIICSILATEQYYCSCLPYLPILRLFLVCFTSSCVLNDLFVKFKQIQTIRGNSELSLYSLISSKLKMLSTL